MHVCASVYSYVSRVRVYMNIYIYTHTYKRKRKICVYICIWHVVMRAHVSMFKYECRGHAGIPVSRLVMDDLLITGTDTFGWCRRVTLESTVLTSALHKAPIVSSALRESIRPTGGNPSATTVWLASTGQPPMALLKTFARYVALRIS